MKKPIKEAIRIMKPKQIFISILAVLFVFPLMGTFAQQAADSVSITQAQSAATTSAAMGTLTGFSCRAAPSQNTMFPARSTPMCLG